MKRFHKLGFLLFALLSTTCGAHAQDINFGASPTWLGHVPVMVALQKGYFKDQGLNVTFQPILSSSDRLRAVTSGAVQFTNLGRTTVISAMARGDHSFYVLANIDDSPGKEGCWARPPYKSISSLKGQKVAVNGSSEITFDGLLEKASMKPKDVEVINLSPNEMAGALAKGDIGAACVWEPLYSGLKSAVPGGVSLGTDKDTQIYQRFGTMAAGDIVVISKPFADQHPDVARKLMTAMFQGADLAVSKPQEAANAVSTYFKQTPAELEPQIRNFSYFGGANWQKHLAVHVSEMQYLASMLYGSGRIPTEPTVGQWVNGSLTPVPETTAAAK